MQTSVCKANHAFCLSCKTNINFYRQAVPAELRAILGKRDAVVGVIVFAEAHARLTIGQVAPEPFNMNCWCAKQRLSTAPRLPSSLVRADKLVLADLPEKTDF